MRISTVGYSVKQGVKNIGRNKMFSLASVATMAACIFVFGLFFSIIMNFQYIVHKAEEGVAISVFFNDDATQEQIDNIGAQLKKQDGVKEIKYVSADEAWETFKDQYFGESRDLAEGSGYRHGIGRRGCVQKSCDFFEKRVNLSLLFRCSHVY